ncbi:GIP [Symbiodinium sp. CCMP2592]|nr:GIP [Symbiodinium sp. CCMP2592]
MPLDANHSIGVLMENLGHTGRTIKLLKVSCNGCEIATHQTWLVGDTKIDQIVVRQMKARSETVARYLTARGYGCFEGGDDFHFVVGCMKLPLPKSALVSSQVQQKSALKPPPSISSVCMLVPVYPPHFRALAARMEMVKRTNTGPPVKSVVVFGDDVESDDFCSRHRARCFDEDFHPLLLEDLLGSAAHAKLKRRLRLQYLPANFKYSGERHGCLAKSAGRIYQAIKKFYGVAYRPSECQTYWVSDAESVPFRKHNLTEHLALNSRSPRIVVSTWHDEPDCANVAADDGTDQACAIMMTNQTNGMRFRNDDAQSVWTPGRWKKVFHNVDQWWYYDRTVTAEWLDFLATSTGMPAWSVFGFYDVSDMSVYGMMMHWSAFYAHPGRTEVVNIRAEIRKVDPSAFSKCCKCSQAATGPGLPGPGPPPMLNGR